MKQAWRLLALPPSHIFFLLSNQKSSSPNKKKNNNNKNITQPQSSPSFLFIKALRHPAQEALELPQRQRHPPREEWGPRNEDDEQ